MEVLKENEEKRSRKEERENQQQQQRARARGGFLRGPGALTEAERQALAAHFIPPRDFEESASKLGMGAAEAKAWIGYMEQVGWAFTNGRPVNGRNFRRPLRMWHLTEREMAAERGSSADDEERRAKEAAAERKRRAEVAADPAAWELCRERCANAKERGGCACGVACPPAHLPRPVPPQECPRFAAKGGGR